VTVSVERFDVPSSSVAHAARWLVLPVVGWAVFAAAGRLLRDRARQPSLPRMSDEWLRTHEAESGRAPDY
jgi:hypothetical protein